MKDALERIAKKIKRGLICIQMREDALGVCPKCCSKLEVIGDEYDGLLHCNHCWYQIRWNYRNKK